MAGSASPRAFKPIAISAATMGAQMQRAVARIAESDCTVLIVGEHGVGKRTLAAQIHAHSHHARSPFLQFESTSLDAQQLLAATSSKGTLYIAEVGDLPLPLQEAIVEDYYRSEQPRSCRLVFGTSRELWEEVRSLRMREDFYYLASAVTLRISPLRFRKSEILPIAEELLTQYSRQFDRPKPILHQEIVGFLMQHDWPDNLPELQTAIKTFVAIGDQSISLAALKAAAPAARGNQHRKTRSLKEATRVASNQIERQLISEVLVSTGGNRKRAADELGISYKALLYKLKQIGAENQPASNRIGVLL